MIELVSDISFRQDGNSGKHLLEGWSFPEPGHVWTVGGESEFLMTITPGAGDLALELDLLPYLVPDTLSRQRLSVAVNDIELGQAELDGAATLGFSIPRDALTRPDRLLVRLRHPDAGRPSDFSPSDDARMLGFALFEARLLRLPALRPAWRSTLPPLAEPAGAPAEAIAEAVFQRSGLSPPDLLAKFESLGQNCEFGLVQRRCGAEPLGLFRFAGIPLSELLRGLDQDFAGIADPANIEIVLNDDAKPEFMIRSKTYEMQYHTFVRVDTGDAERVYAAETRKLSLLHRKFLEVLEGGEKLFVLHRNRDMAAAEALPVLNLLRSYGANSLLFVSESDVVAPGTVRRLEPGFYQGSIDHFAPIEFAGQMNLPAWVSICANAYRLWREETETA